MSTPREAIARLQSAADEIAAETEKLNIENTRRAVRGLRLAASRRDGEWHIKLPGGTAASASYTHDDDDGFATAKVIAAAVAKADNDNARAV